MTVAVNSGVGWKKETYVNCRNTEGMFRYDVFHGHIARITIKNPDGPELPNMEFIEHIGWSYLTTEYNSIKGDRVVYDFIAGDEENEEQLRMVVFIFDTLYG